MACRVGYVRGCSTGREPPRLRIKLSRHYFGFGLAGCNQEFFQLLAQFTGLRTILLAPSQVHQLVWIGALIIELVLMISCSRGFFDVPEGSATQ